MTFARAWVWACQGMLGFNLGAGAVNLHRGNRLNAALFAVAGIITTFNLHGAVQRLRDEEEEHA